MKILLLTFLFPILALSSSCPDGEALILNNCWTLKDQKYLLDNSQPIETFCKSGYRIPTKEEYVAIQKGRLWPQIQISSREHYLTSSKNDLGHYFFVNYYGTDNGFYAEPRGSGTFVHARCIKEAAPLTMEEEILSALQETSNAIIVKSDEEIKAAYAQAGQDKSSVEYSNILSNVQDINANKNELVNALGAETSILFNHITTKVESNDSGELDQVLAGTYHLYENLRDQSSKTVLGDTEINKQLTAHNASAMDIVKTEEVKPSDQINTKQIIFPSVQETLKSGDKVGYIEKFKNFIKEIKGAGPLSAARLLATTSYALAASPNSNTSLVPQNNGNGLSSLPTLDISAVNKINEKRIANKKDPIKLTSASISAAASATSASAISSSALASTTSALASVTSAPATSTSSVANPAIGAKLDAKNFNITRNAYQLQSRYTQLTAKGDNEAVNYLIDLEKLITYTPTSVEIVSKSANPSRLLTDLSGKVGGYTSPKVGLELNVDRLLPMFKRLKEHDAATKVLKLTSSEKSARADEKIELENEIYNLSLNLLNPMLRNAINFCPAGMEIHQTWQSLSPSGSGDHHYSCQDAKGTIYLFKFALNEQKFLVAARELIKRKTTANGLKSISYQNLTQTQNNAPSVRQFICPEKYSFHVFGKEVQGNFESAKYSFVTAGNGIYETGPIPTSARQDGCIPQDSKSAYWIPAENGVKGIKRYSGDLCEFNSSLGLKYENFRPDGSYSDVRVSLSLEKMRDVVCSYRYSYSP